MSNSNSKGKRFVDSSGQEWKIVQVFVDGDTLMVNAFGHHITVDKEYTDTYLKEI